MRMNLTNRSFVRPLLMFAVAAALSSCVRFSNALVEDPLPVDGQLIGYWAIVGSGGKGTLLVETDGPSAITAIAFDDPACSKVERYSAIRTEIAGHDFLDTSEAGQDGKLVRLSPVGYEFPDSNHLSLFLPDPKMFEQAVNGGDLSGAVSKERAPADGKSKNGTEFTLVQIDASTADVRRWISMHPDAIHAPFAQFERRDISLAPQCSTEPK